MKSVEAAESVVKARSVAALPLRGHRDSAVYLAPRVHSRLHCADSRRSVSSNADELCPGASPAPGPTAQLPGQILVRDCDRQELPVNSFPLEAAQTLPSGAGVKPVAKSHEFVLEPHPVELPLPPD